MIDEYRVKGFGFWEVNGRGFMILLVQKYGVIKYSFFIKNLKFNRNEIFRLKRILYK